MGRLESQKKKTMTRRNRRQPERLDLRGHLRGHRVEIAIAIDISALKTSDEYTFKHSVDVATMAMVIAKTMGMPKNITRR